MMWFTKILEVSSSNVTESCKHHVQKMIHHFFMGSTWALKMIDSSTKFPSSVLKGNMIDLGNYDECLSVDVKEEWGSFVGQHCIAEITVPVDTESIKLPFHLTNLPLGWSLCIPSSCSSGDLEKLMRIFIPLNLTVKPDTCSSHNLDAPFRPIDWIATAVLVLLVLACIAGTTVSVLVRNSERHFMWLTIFSWYKNGKQLLSTKSHPDSIPILHGIRFFSIAWVVLGHSYQFRGMIPEMNLLDGEEDVRTWRYLIVTNAFCAVDTFFLLSGLLLSYVFLKTMDKGHRFNLLVFYLHRYLRIFPVLAIMVLLQASLLSKLGSGPLWKNYAINAQQVPCEEYWWSTLLFVQNYVNTSHMCVPVAWFLAVDMQLYWISPIFLLVLHKKPNFGIILLIASSLVGIALGFHQAYIYHDRPFDISERGSISERYYQTHMRFVPWLIGLGSGYLLYRTTEWRKELAEEKEHISKKAVAGLWFFIIILCVGVIHWVYPFEQKDYKYNALETALYLTLSRPLWAIGVSCLIFICTCGYGGFVNSFLTWNVFQPLSRLSFCIYLTHVSILVVILGKVKVPGYLTDIDLLLSFLGSLTLVIMISFITSLTIESPIIGLEKIIFKKARNSHQSSNSSVGCQESNISKTRQSINMALKNL